MGALGRGGWEDTDQRGRGCSYVGKSRDGIYSMMTVVDNT